MDGKVDEDYYVYYYYVAALVTSLFFLLLKKKLNIISYIVYSKLFWFKILVMMIVHNFSLVTLLIFPAKDRDHSG